MRRSPLWALVLSFVALVLLASPARAQDVTSTTEGPPRSVRISFETGALDGGGDHDFSITAVVVDGDLDPGKDFTVELRGPDDQVLWTATTTFVAPTTRIAVVPPVPVGKVDSAGISQEGTPIDPSLVESELSKTPVQGGGGSSGQLATSMVLVILIAVIIMRTPLPSSSSQRWTR